MSGVTPSRAASRVPWLPPSLRPLAGLVREGVPLVASAAVLAALLVAAEVGTLPAAAATAAFLTAAVWWDVRALRIPNALTLPALAAVLVGAGISGGWGAAGQSGLAMFAALALLFGPFAWGWLGAGDVKALAVLAGLFGLPAFLGALWWMLLVGGLGAIALLAAHGELGDLLRRWGRSLWLTLATRRVHYEPAAATARARTGLPFAVAMGLGTAAFAVWGAPW